MSSRWKIPSPDDNDVCYSLWCAKVFYSQLFCEDAKAPAWGTAKIR
jgi:hypothetical protein